MLQHRFLPRAGVKWAGEACREGGDHGAHGGDTEDLESERACKGGQPRGWAAGRSWEPK